MIEDCNGIPICTIRSISLPGNSFTNWILIQDTSVSFPDYLLILYAFILVLKLVTDDEILNPDSLLVQQHINMLIALCV